MSERIILYCGMADDILTPLVMVPEATTLYVISKFDMAFCTGQTWESQQNDILTILRRGDDEESQHHVVYGTFDPRYPDRALFPANKLPKGPATDIEVVREADPWHVRFMYGGRERNLIYWHHRDYYYTWPTEIRGITDLFSIGAPFHVDGQYELAQMVMTRVMEDAYYYTCAYPDIIYDQILMARHKPVGVMHGIDRAVWEP